MGFGMILSDNNLYSIVDAARIIGISRTKLRNTILKHKIVLKRGPGKPVPTPWFTLHSIHAAKLDKDLIDQVLKILSDENFKIKKNLYWDN